VGHTTTTTNYYYYNYCAPEFEVGHFSEIAGLGGLFSLGELDNHHVRVPTRTKTGQLLTTARVRAVVMLMVMAYVMVVMMVMAMVMAVMMIMAMVRVVTSKG
jgi:hypothetical protein